MPIYAITFLVFLGGATVLFFLMYMVFPKRTVLDERLESFREEVPSAEGYLLQRPPSAWQKFLEKLGKQIPLRPEEYGKYTRMLVASGIRGEGVPVFIGSKLFLAAVLPAVYLFYGIPAGQGLTMLVLSSSFLAIVGFLIPSLWLSRKVKNRKLRIFYDLPDILDLMTVCVEAGLSIDAAMVRIAGDRQFENSPLAREMMTAVQETRAGKSRHEALRDMGERSMEDDLKAFSAMLVQTERLGTSLADSLRIHSDSLRTKRRQLAEEEAAKTSIKLLFPLVFLLLPALFVVLLIPALIRLTRFLGEL
jgi:tight adherence protein C